MSKTVLYRWHLDADLKRRLAHAARAERTTVARLLDRVVREWLARREADEEAEQRRLRAEFLKVVGRVNLGKGPYTRQRIREHIRARLAEKRKRRSEPEAGSV